MLHLTIHYVFFVAFIFKKFEEKSKNPIFNLADTLLQLAEIQSITEWTELIFP